MPGPAKYYKLLGDAVQNWQIDEAAVDKAVRRVLRIILLSGRMDKKVSKGAVNTPGAPETVPAIGRGSHHPAQERRRYPAAGQGRQSPLQSSGRTPPKRSSKAAAVPRSQPLYRVSPLEALKKRLDGKVKDRV